MKKIMLIVVIVLGMGATQAQDLSVSGGWVHAQEFLGDDIKDGASFKVALDFDIFKKNNFYFGPSFNVTGFTALTSDIETIEKKTLFGGGLLAGFDAGRFTYKGGLSIGSDILTVKSKDPLYFMSVLNNMLEYKFKKDGNLGLRIGHDYFFNQTLFHYTHQTTLGLVLKF